MLPPFGRGFTMADDASNTLGGGVRAFLGSAGFLVMMFGGYTIYDDKGTRTGIGLIAVGLPLFILPWAWSRIRLLFAAKEPRPKALEYLNYKDSELGPAICTMVRHSAAGRWYAAQMLVATGAPIGDLSLLAWASNVVGRQLIDGDIQVRGRRPGQVEYENIAPTDWRSTALHFVPDNITIWRMRLIPTGGVEFLPDGTEVARDPESEQRNNRLRAFDSLIVDGPQFEALWPKREKIADKKRRRFLWRAHWRRLDKDEIQRLSGKWQFQLLRLAGVVRL